MCSFSKNFIHAVSVCIPCFMNLESKNWKTKNKIRIGRYMLLKNACNSPSRLINWKIFFKITIMYSINSWSVVSLISLLTLLWRRPLSYGNQSIELLRKSMDWFLYDNGLRHERFNGNEIKTIYIKMNLRNKNGY